MAEVKNKQTWDRINVIPGFSFSASSECQGNSYDEQLHEVVAADTPNTTSFPYTTICRVLQPATPVGID